jgi:hypothetical protein
LVNIQSLLFYDWVRTGEMCRYFKARYLDNGCVLREMDGTCAGVYTCGRLKRESPSFD